MFWVLSFRLWDVTSWFCHSPRYVQLVPLSNWFSGVRESTCRTACRVGRGSTCRTPLDWFPGSTCRTACRDGRGPTCRTPASGSTCRTPVDWFPGGRGSTCRTACRTAHASVTLPLSVTVRVSHPPALHHTCWVWALTFQLSLLVGTYSGPFFLGFCRALPCVLLPSCCRLTPCLLCLASSVTLALSRSLLPRCLVQSR